MTLASSIPAPLLCVHSARGGVCDEAGGGGGWSTDRALPLPGHLKGLLAAPRKTDDGYWIVEGFAARADNVQRYSHGPHSAAFFRPASEVFAPESLDAWRGIPVIVHHPQQRGERKPLLDPEMAARLARGTVMDAIPLPEHGLLKVRLKIWGQEAIDAWRRKGMVELSAGYWRDVDPTPGTAPDGTPYDAVQRRIRPNHLSFVDDARAGRLARIATDSTDGDDMLLYIIKALDGGRWAVCDHAGEPVSTTDYATEAAALKAAQKLKGDDAPSYKTVALDSGLSVRVHAEDATRLMDKLDLSAVQRAQTDAAEARQTAERYKGERDAEATRASQLRTTVDSLTGERDAIKAERDALKAEVDAAALSTLKAEVVGLVGEAAVTDGMSARDLKCAVISRVPAYKDLKTDGKPEDYINALYDGGKAMIREGRGHLVGNGGKPPVSVDASAESPRDKWLKTQNPNPKPAAQA